jgi:hypothetical protein
MGESALLTFVHQTRKLSMAVDLNRDLFSARTFSSPNIRLARMIAQQLGQADIADETDV